MNVRTGLVLIALVLMASAGMAQGPDAQSIIELQPMPVLAPKLEASGVAAKLTKSGTERFVTKVVTNFEDGTIVVVRGYHDNGKTFDIGAITMLLGSGSLELKSTADPSEVFPLSNLAAITVEYRGQVLLRGEFPRLDTP